MRGLPQSPAPSGFAKYWKREEIVTIPNGNLWYRRRTYLHFDLPVGPEKALLIASNRERVASHAFYPLISYELTTEKLASSDGPEPFEKKTKIREIKYAAHLDSHIYSYYASDLARLYEDFLTEHDLLDSVLAFRPLGRSNIDFARVAFENIATRRSCVAVRMDVSGFFDNLDHKILKRAWAALLDSEELPADHYAVFKSITKYSYVRRLKLFAEFGISLHNPKNGRKRICSPLEFRSRVREKRLISQNPDAFGIPQGSPISAVLSNIYMMEFDKNIKEIVARNGGVYFRYCDDILLILPNSTQNNVRKAVTDAFHVLKLEINQKKSETRYFRRNELGGLESDKPLQYLGFTFDGQRVLIRSAAFARFSQKMKKAVRLAKSTMRRWNRIRYARGENQKTLYRKSLYKKYSHLGNQNFLTYGYKAARIMNSKSIKGQLKPLWARLQAEIEKPQD